VYRVRRWRQDDRLAMAERLLERLYGAFLPAPEAEAEADLG